MLIGYQSNKMYYTGEVVHIINGDVNIINKVITKCGEVSTYRTGWLCFSGDVSRVTSPACLSGV